jgi:hypothetical protein
MKNLTKNLKLRSINSIFFFIILLFWKRIKNNFSKIIIGFIFLNKNSFYIAKIIKIYYLKSLKINKFFQNNKIFFI